MSTGSPSVSFLFSPQHQEAHSGHATREHSVCGELRGETELSEGVHVSSPATSAGGGHSRAACSLPFGSPRRGSSERAGPELRQGLGSKVVWFPLNLGRSGLGGCSEDRMLPAHNLGALDPSGTKQAAESQPGVVLSCQSAHKPASTFWSRCRSNALNLCRPFLSHHLAGSRLGVFQ